MPSVTLPLIKYPIYNIQDLKVIDKDRIQIKDGVFRTTQRFWDSLCSKFGISTSEFNHFTHDEVFEKVAQSDQPQMRVMVQLSGFNDPEKKLYDEPMLLGVSSPDKPFVSINDLTWILQQTTPSFGYPNAGSDLQWRDGIILSRHIPSVGMKFCVNGDNDQLESKFVLETPIDGYGKPIIYLAFLRTLDMTAIIAYNKNYQSIVSIGNDNNQRETLLRLVQSFNNEDGFTDLKKRILTAQNSWSSIYEVVCLNKIIWNMNLDDFTVEYLKETYPDSKPDNLDTGEVKKDILLEVQELTGDLRAIYGVAKLDALSEKKQHVLPTRASVYQLIALASKYATHNLYSQASRKLEQYIGDILGKDYDLEDSCDQFRRFEDFLVKGDKGG